MKRRDFITLIGSAVLAPVAARAQQPAIPVVGFLHASAPDSNTHSVAAFLRGLSETGFVEGRNVAIEYRWAHNDANRFPELSADLVRRQVAVIVTPVNTALALAAKGATTTIPIVFSMGTDAVKQAVASYNRPGGNVTGITFMTSELGAKRLGLLLELGRKPSGSDFSSIQTTRSPPRPRSRTFVRRDRPRVGYRSSERDQSSRDRCGICYLFEKRADALVVNADPLFNSRRIQLATLRRATGCRRSLRCATSSKRAGS